jgi:hypothetical protein
LVRSRQEPAYAPDHAGREASEANASNAQFFQVHLFAQRIAPSKKADEAAGQ